MNLAMFVFGFSMGVCFTTLCFGLYMHSDRSIAIGAFSIGLLSIIAAAEYSGRKV